MTTQTQSREASTQAYDTPEARLVAFLPLARAAGRRWASRVGLDRATAEDLAQEAALALWRVLQKRSDAPASYLEDVADHAARDALERGKSVDRPLPRERQRTYQVVSLEALVEGKDGQDTVEDALARRKRRGESPNPTEETALASVLYHDLRDRLTPRQWQVFDLRLQGCTRKQIGAELGVGRTRVNTIICIIAQKARPLWEEEPPKLPLYRQRRARGLCVYCGQKTDEGFARCAPCRERFRLYQGIYRREKGKNWQRTLRAQWRKQGRCPRCGRVPEPGRKTCARCLAKNREYLRRHRLHARLGQAG